MTQQKSGVGTLLCIALFPSNTGYAWNFIEGLYGKLARLGWGYGWATYVAYPEIDEPPRTLEGTGAEAVELAVNLDSWRSVWRLARFVRSKRVTHLYLSDLQAWHPAYTILRLVGLKRIVVHDHSSGTREVPRGMRRHLKRLARRLPGSAPDAVIAVSHFVARRKIEVDLVPPDQVHVVHNSIETPRREEVGRDALRRELGASAGDFVVGCACRAVPEKGVEHLFRAFDEASRILAERTGRGVHLAYIGDGPSRSSLERLRDELTCGHRMRMLGFRADAAELIGQADVAVVPSLWAEAFGLAALEPMVQGVPVIVSGTGGLSEIVSDGETGLIVPPGDEAALVDALVKLGTDVRYRERMAEEGRRHAATAFEPGRLFAELARHVVPELEIVAGDQ